MKRVISLLLILLLAFSADCAGEKEGKPSIEGTESQTETIAEASSTEAAAPTEAATEAPATEAATEAPTTEAASQVASSESDPTQTASGQEIDPNDIPYEFIIPKEGDPGYAEWKSIKGWLERYATIDIPEEICNRLTTRALMISVLKSPYIIFPDTYNEWEKGCDELAEYYRSFRTFLDRSDAGTSLLHLIKNQEEYMETYSLTEVEISIAKRLKDEYLPKWWQQKR